MTRRARYFRTCSACSGMSTSSKKSRDTRSPSLRRRESRKAAAASALCGLAVRRPYLRPVERVGTVVGDGAHAHPVRVRCGRGRGQRSDGHVSYSTSRACINARSRNALHWMHSGSWVRLVQACGHQQLPGVSAVPDAVHVDTGLGVLQQRNQSLRVHEWVECGQTGAILSCCPTDAVGCYRLRQVAT